MSFFFFNDTATTEIYTLSLHDALPICARGRARAAHGSGRVGAPRRRQGLLPHARAARGDRRYRPSSGRRGTRGGGDRKSTRLNSSHLVISYAVFCLKKKNTHLTTHILS